jgi:hypothetical protein
VNLVDEVTKLSGKRNNAIHAPLVFVIDVAGGAVEVEPLVIFGNEKAAKLGTRDLPNFNGTEGLAKCLRTMPTYSITRLTTPTTNCHQSRSCQLSARSKARSRHPVEPNRKNPSGLER